MISEAQARALLIQAITAAGSQQALADQVPCCHTYISACVSGQKPIGPKLAAALGLRVELVRVFKRADHASD